MSRVEVANLSFKLGSTQILKSLNLTVENGEFLVLLGASGCGKSTLLNCIAGLQDVSDGQVFIGDRNVTWMEPKDRGIGMVFQSYALYPQMTVEKNLSFGLRVAGLSRKAIRERVEKTADVLQLSSLLKRKPASLSGGQKQRVAIGRAMVRDAAVFLLDEPLSNLDANLRDDLRVELKRLHQRLGNTIIYVTHDQTEALTLADRIAVMKDGVIQQLDTPQKIYKQPNNRFVAEFLGSPRMSFLEGHLVNKDNAWFFATTEQLMPLAQYEFEGTSIDGQRVSLGIRPEYITIDDGAKNQSIVLRLKVEAVEPAGAYTLLVSRFAESELTIKVNSESEVMVGETIDVGFNASQISLFCEEGQRL